MAALSAQSIRKRCEGAVKMVYPFFERTEIYWHEHYKEWRPYTDIISTIAHIREEASAGVNGSSREATELNYLKQIVKLKKIKRWSYGLSSCGYDLRLAKDVWVWPLFGRLAHTIESFNMPNDLKAEVKDKSSNARRFFLVQNTIIEPGWRGNLTLEITSDRPWPRKLRAGMPIAQVVFELLDEPTEQPYPEDGKYQDQNEGPQEAI